MIKNALLIAVGSAVPLRPDMRAHLAHCFRLLTLAFAAVCAVALNHRHVAVVRVVANADSSPASSRQPVVAAGTHRVVIRERVSLETVHSDALTVAGPAAAWLPAERPDRDPLGTWLKARTRTLGLPATMPVRALTRAVPAFARLLGASVAPQAP